MGKRSTEAFQEIRSFLVISLSAISFFPERCVLHQDGKDNLHTSQTMLQSLVESTYM